MKRFQHLAALTLCLATTWVAPAQANVVTEWNALAMQCINRPGLGVLLDIAIVQAAVHDAVQAIEHRYEPYFARPAASGTESSAADGATPGTRGRRDGAGSTVS